MSHAQSACSIMVVASSISNVIDLTFRNWNNVPYSPGESVPAESTQSSMGLSEEFKLMNRNHGIIPPLDSAVRNFIFSTKKNHEA
jgi:hypothetical protein